MKKHKSVVAILLAVMMIFTFMPTMAFAATTGTGENAAVWSDDFSTVTYHKTQFKTEKTWNKTTGLVTVKPVADPTLSDSAAVEVPDIETTYYDLNGATLLVGGKTATTFLQGEFDTVFNGTGKVKLAMPSDAKLADGTEYAQVPTADRVTAAMNLTGWDIAIEKPELVKGSTEDQKFTVVAIITSESEADGSNVPFKVGNNPSATVTFKGVTITAADAEFYYDSASEDNLVSKGNVAYTGEDHTVVMNDMPGFTVAYSVLNKSTGAYEAGTPSVKNVGDTQSVQAVVTNNAAPTTDKQTYTFNIGVKAATAPTFGFEEDGNFDSYEYAVEGEEYDAYEFLVVNSVKANKKAVAANEAELKEYFKDYYTISEETKKYIADTVFLTIEDKELTDAEKTALAKKYATLVKNFGGLKIEIAEKADAAVVHLNQNVKDYEVEFTKAITKKTYKANKKGKLAKNKSFTVKAVANNGKEVAYKLVNVESPKIKINKTTGKVTLKKGLKKGTYKIKIKAYVPGASFQSYEYQTVTVKIKK